MEQINMTVTPRTTLGKGPSGRIRKEGGVPAVLYGAGLKEAVSLTLKSKEAEKALHGLAGGNVIVKLVVEGEGAGKTHMAMFKEVTRHALTGNLEHIDLLEIRMDHAIHVDVPIHITGKAAGIAFGGIIQLEARKVKIECLPTNIPSSFDVDVTPLNVGNALHFRDIKLPEGVKLAGDPDATIVSVVAPTAEVSAKTAEEVQAELAKSFEEKDKEGGAEAKEEKKK